MRKLLAVLVVTAATASLVVGSGGFSSASADRAMSVDVVGDDEAYMSLDYSDATVSGGKEVTFVTVSNRFTEEVEITVDYEVESDDGGQIESESGNETEDVGVGEEFDVAVELDCQSNGRQDATVSFDVDATGDSVSAETSESRHVDYQVICNNSRDEGDDDGEESNDDGDCDDDDVGDNDDNDGEESNGDSDCDDDDEGSDDDDDDEGEGDDDDGDEGEGDDDD